MRWIVKSDFFRVPALEDVKVVDAVPGVSKTSEHPRHFHAGQIIELGESANEEELKKTGKDCLDSPKMKAIIAGLRLSGRIGDAADKKIVERVTEECRIERQRLANQEKHAAQANGTAASQQFAAALTELAKSIGKKSDK